MYYVKCPYCDEELELTLANPYTSLLEKGEPVEYWHSCCRKFFTVRLVDGKPVVYTDKEIIEKDDRPQCCKDHDVYGATCDTCDYGDGAEEESEDDKICTYDKVQRNVTVEEVERLEEELRCARSEVADLKNLIIKLLFDRYGF